MKLFGFEITRTKQTGSAVPSVPRSSWLYGGAGWWPLVREPFTGAWQRNMELRAENILTYSAVYACVTLIASDIAKIRLRLVQRDSNNIWTETTSPAFSPVLKKPNRYQTRLKFVEQWITSKLLHGNAYVLKERDERNVVVSLYVLDPCLTKPLVAPDGSVFYQLGTDNLTGIDRSNVIVPASEIIHDTMVCLYHPLCGVSPLSACGLAAIQGLAIQGNSTRFFTTNSQPGGVLTAPGMISPDVASRIKEHWDNNYTGANAGKVAVLGDGLKFERMGVNAVDAQLIEQLKWTAEQVCTAFHVPPYMIGVGEMPTYNNIEALVQQYYGQCLQVLIESCEACLDEGLKLPDTYGTEFDLTDLLRMDTPTKVKALADGIKGGIFAPNEGRARFDLKPVEGGDDVYLQQQNYSLAALAKRDAKDDPFATGAPKPAAPSSSADEPADEPAEDAPPAQGSAADESRAIATELFARAKSVRTRLVA